MVWRVLGKRADDAADGGKEAHVQHAVHFVEHEHLDVAEVDGPAAEEVFEASGGGDDEARAAGELVELRVLAEAAADQYCVVLGGGDELVEVLQHLHGELARGQQDERADGAALALGAGSGLASMRSIMGMRKLRVLPVPVEAVARMSSPSSAGGMALACTGVGVMKPAAVRRSFSQSEMLKSLKWTFFRKGRWVRGSVSISEASTMASMAAGFGCVVRRRRIVSRCCLVHVVVRCFGNSLRLKSCGCQNGSFSIFLYV